jgi:chemotaxis signal transduction protein
MDLDFDAVRRRLATAERRLLGERTPEERREILERQASALAGRARRGVTEARERVAETVVARRAELSFAFPVEAVAEIRRVTVSVLPHATEVLRGLFQIRGQPYCLADLGPFFDVAPTPRPADTLVILLTGRPGSLGLVVDEILASRTLFADDLDTGLKRGRATFVRSVTRDLVHLVDVEILLSLPQIHPATTGTTFPAP